MTACSDDPSGPRPPGPVASVTIEPTSGAVQVGAQWQIRATLRDAGGQELTGRPVVWTTSAAAVASVSDSGLVTGVAPGQATVTASAEGKSDE
ncbi:MAG: Ig-like domain-containing protein, partial [Gemmatimonadales bacterium]|nr:Ig-like domain-containing protein [Gemmatimonadales bacterium]